MNKEGKKSGKIYSEKLIRAQAGEDLHANEERNTNPGRAGGVCLLSSSCQAHSICCKIFRGSKLGMEKMRFPAAALNIAKTF